MRQGPEEKDKQDLMSPARGTKSAQKRSTATRGMTSEEIQKQRELAEHHAAIERQEMHKRIDEERQRLKEAEEKRQAEIQAERERRQKEEDDRLQKLKEEEEQLQAKLQAEREQRE